MLYEVITNHFASSDCVQSETINDTRNLKNVLDYDYSDTQTSTNTDVVGTDKPVILIVEDNLDVQSFIKENLEKEFYCLQAYDGIQGLNLARQHSPNLIVSDVVITSYSIHYTKLYDPRNRSKQRKCLPRIADKKTRF